MRKAFMLACLIAPAWPWAALAQDQEVGVTEKLGQTAPLDLQFNDEDGRPVRLRELINEPTILTLNFFTCTGLCTPLLMGLTDALNELRLEPDKDFRVVTVSFDPEDTPEVAHGKRISYLQQLRRPFPPSAWRFLTGDEAAIKALTGAVGFQYRKQGDQYIHPGLVVILSPQGKITRYMYGISFLPFDLQLALQEASKGLARPTVAKMLRYCYSYDPAGRQYIFRFRRAAGVLVLLFAAGLFLVLTLGGGRKAGHG